MIRFEKHTGVRTFVQIGVYEGRNKRTQSLFRVIEDVKLEDLKPAIAACINGLIEKKR